MLNKYLNNPEICRCPSDLGDPLRPAWSGTCWDGWGNSYLMQWYKAAYGVEHVGGRIDNNWKQILDKSTTGNRISKRPTTKIILGDWNWYSQRPLTDPKTLWHRVKGKRVIPFLFGDGHTENWEFPPAYEKAGNAPSNINDRFW